MTNYEIKQITWDDIMSLSKNIINQIKEKNIEIDTLVPIIRGGMPLALILASNLKKMDTACLHIRRSATNDTNAEFGDSVFKGITNEETIKNKNILLVEDIVDEGFTLDKAIEIVKKYNPKNIYIATFYNYNKEKYKDIISGKFMEEKIWIVFPWELEVDKYEN